MSPSIVLIYHNECNSVYLLVRLLSAVSSAGVHHVSIRLDLEAVFQFSHLVLTFKVKYSATLTLVDIYTFYNVLGLIIGVGRRTSWSWVKVRGNCWLIRPLYQSWSTSGERFRGSTWPQPKLSQSYSIFTEKPYTLKSFFSWLCLFWFFLADWLELKFGHIVLYGLPKMFYLTSEPGFTLSTLGQLCSKLQVLLLCRLSWATASSLHPPIQALAVVDCCTFTQFSVSHRGSVTLIVVVGFMLLVFFFFCCWDAEFWVVALSCLSGLINFPSIDHVILSGKLRFC